MHYLSQERFCLVKDIYYYTGVTPLLSLILEIISIALLISTTTNPLLSSA